MKNLLFSLMVTFLFSSVSFSQAKLSSEENKLVTDYISSNDFKNNSFFNNKKVDLLKSTITYSSDGLKTPKITIAVVNELNDIIGSIEVVKKTTQKLKLPNGNNYFGMYRDFSNFNFSNLSGYILMIDLNYDNHIFNKIYYLEGKPTKNEYNEIPSSIFENYQSVLTFNVESIARTQAAASGGGLGGASLCDSNGNGNISFSECYFCFNGACATNPNCYTLCYGAGDVLGWTISGSGFPLCQGSIAISCVYIAAVY